MAMTHGGNLLAIAKQMNSDVSEWLDLSTGVSPFTYPMTEMPEQCWNRLPEQNDGLEQAAKHYYAASIEPLVVAGSQAAIMALPACITKQLGYCGVIAIPRVGYKEHQHAWQSFHYYDQAWQIEFYDDYPSEQQIERSDVVLMINPNNPTGVLHSQQQMQQLAETMQSKNGFVIVDEAFGDSVENGSLLPVTSSFDHCVVLRSVGKFFGLAGARVGFLFAGDKLLEIVQEYLGPWTVTGPSRWVVRQALQDTSWQMQNRIRLNEQMKKLRKLLELYPLADHFSINPSSTGNRAPVDRPSSRVKFSGTDLFTTVYLDHAETCHRLLCEQKILTRLCDEKNAIRFGLPANPQQWQQLENGLQQVVNKRKESA